MASSALSFLENYSRELSELAENAGRSVVAVQGRHRMAASGIQWRKGVIVTADHAIRRENEVTVILNPEKSVSATVAGRDPSTDLAILKLQDDALGVPACGDGSNIRLGHFVLALGRSWRGNLVASAGIIGGLAGEWRTWQGGRVDQHIRLDLELYRGFSGGPLLSTQGKVLGINTSGVARGRAVTIPVSTVNRVVDELLDKGHIAQPYLGLAMQPVALPEALCGKFKSGAASGLLVVHVEAGGPADQAGIVLGDTLVELQGESLSEIESIRERLATAKVGDQILANVLRAGVPVEVRITLGDRPRG